ncbi:hypothetical protein EV401DRAFT_1895711 [Pisolithus croceorrhizus]|nr:hypothetical protein EV401DRAFT_1895711 [Pisolithus croceorrhizus]
MSTPQAFNITPRMIHLQLFRWFKQFAEGSILMDTALDNIEFALGSDFDSGEWMDLAYCIVMEPGCWGDVEKSYPPNHPKDQLCQVIKNLPLALPVVVICHLVEGSRGSAVRRRGGGEEEEEEEKEEDEQEEGGSIHRPQQAELSGKRSYLQSIDSLCKQFGSDIGDSVVVNCPPNRQIPTASSRTFALEYIKLQGLVAMTLPWLPHWVWVRIQKSMYKGDIGYIEESADSDAVVILVAPCWLPYDLPEESGESVRFNVELARMAGLDLMPILSPSGTEIGYSCDGQQFVHGLFRLTLPANTLEIVELPHPNDIRFHVAAGIDPYFVEETLNLFSAQFWREQDAVEIREGDLRGKKGALTNVDWHKRSAVVWCDDDAFKCTLHELRRVFSLGDTLEIIAGPFCGETGYVVALHEHTIILVVMRPNQTSEDSSHFWRTKPYRAMLYECIVVRMLARQELSSGLVPTVRKGKGKEDSKRDPTPSQSMVAMNASDLHIERAPGTLTLSKDKGYNIAVGDTVEVARGQWRHSQGIVKAVDLIKASLDFVHLEDGIQINIPITFSHKVKEHFDYGLSKFVGCDVWVIGSDKKGTRATLHSLGRMSSWVAIFGQPIELKNNQVAMLTGMLLDGTLLPLQLQCSLKSLHNRSFITPVVPHNVTPPPSPGLSNAGPSDAWSITPDDIIRTQTPDYGEVPWLFQSEFCDFKSFHLGFNVSLGKHIVRTVCPDRFVGQNGPAPSGSVCITVMRHNTGSAIQHLTIPARYLMPANPTRQKSTMPGT